MSDSPLLQPNVLAMPELLLPTEPEGPEPYPGDTRELLTQCVAWFEAAEMSCAPARLLSERDEDYYNGAQWTAEEQRILGERGQPTLTNNYIRRKIDLLTGLERRARSDPKAFPRTQTEEGRADAATQVLRFISDDNAFDVVRSEAYKNLLIHGFGAAEVVVEEGADGPDVRINHVPWSRIFHDPHSSKPDFIDARYVGFVLWKDREEVLEEWPGSEGVLETSMGAPAGNFGTYADKPRTAVAWTDSRRTRVRVVQIYFRKGEDWWTGTFSRGGWLSEPRLSGYLDKRGRNACPLLMQSAYVDRENNRHGVVRDLISPQDSINKRESKAMHQLSVRQVLAEEGAVEDEDAARREFAKPDGWIRVNPGLKLDILQNQDLHVGQMQLLQHAVAQMNAAGPNAAMAGNDPRDQSGRAIMAQQTGGAVQNEHLADALRQWTRRVYEAAFMAARQYWPAEKSIRVTDDEKRARYITINRQIMFGQQLAEMPEDRRAAEMQRLGIVPGDPRLQEWVVENGIGDLNVDITVEEGPDTPMVQAEQFRDLTGLASSGMLAGVPGPVLAKVLIKASSLRNKDELVEMIDAAQQQAQQAAAAQAQQATEMQQAQAPLMQARAEVEMRRLAADAALKEAGAANKQADTVERIHKLAIHPSTPGPSVVAVPDPVSPLGVPFDEGLMTP